MRTLHMLRFAALGTAERNRQPQNVKQCYVLRDPRLRFDSYTLDAVKIIITICVNLLRFALSFYVLGNVTFCGRSFTPLKSISNQCLQT